MNLPRWTLGLISATLAFLVADAPIRAREQAAASGVVAGQVIDATTRRPISRATVTLSMAAASGATPQPGAPAAQTRRAVAVTNTDGRFVFRDVPAGSYALASTADAYAPGATARRRPSGPSGTFTLDAGARVTDAVLPMWRLAAISGVVRDDRGEPVIGSYVTALRRSINGGRFELAFDRGEASDDRGHYRISGLSPGSYVVTIRHNFNSVAVSTIDAYQAAVTAGTTAAITREWPMSGALRLSSSGLVIDGWQLSVSGGEPPLPGPNGTLLIHPTFYYPNVTSVGEATVLTLSAADDRPGIDLTLPLVQAVRVSGVLLGPEGPAANYGLRLIPADARDPVFDIPVAYCTTDRAGNFTFLGVAPGAYVINAYRVAPTGPMFSFAPAQPGAPPGSERVEMIQPPANPSPSLFANVPITVGSANVSNIAVTLQPGARVSGKLVFDGATQPTAAEIQRITIALKPLNGELPRSSIQPGSGPRPDATGAFQLLGHPPGRYHLEVTSPAPNWSVASIRVGATDAAGQAFTLGARDVEDVVVTMTDKTMMLSGTVRSAEAGGSAESTVLLIPADFTGWHASGMSPRRTGTTLVPVSGSFQIRVPLPGDYIVVAVPPEITVTLEPEFLKQITPQGVRVSFAAGESKTQLLTVSRSR